MAGGGGYSSFSSLKKAISKVKTEEPTDETTKANKRALNYYELLLHTHTPVATQLTTKCKGTQRNEDLIQWAASQGRQQNT